MAIVAGFDVPRGQITFDAVDTETGEVSPGRIDSNPPAVRAWTERFRGSKRRAKTDRVAAANPGDALPARRPRRRGRAARLAGAAGRARAEARPAESVFSSTRGRSLRASW
jgi:hypothetical protein